MTETPTTADELIERAGHGDEAARRELLELYRDHLRRMVAARLDRRLRSRVDASDVVQEALTDAAGRLDEYLRDQPMPFLRWLRQLAGERIRETHRSPPDLAESQRLAGEAGRGVSPTNRPWSSAASSSRPTRARAIASCGWSSATPSMEAVSGLPPRDREVLLMRHIEKLDTTEIADALGMAEPAVRARLFRALNRLRAKLVGETDS